MNVRLNSIPLQIIQNLGYSLNPNLNREAIYPDEIFILQEQSFQFYYQKLWECIVREEQLCTEKIVEWQLRQAYRIINAMCASSDPSIKSYLYLLTSHKLYLEQQPYLKNLLQQISLGTIQPELVMSGHGAWLDTDGYVNLLSVPVANIILHAPLGAKLAAHVAEAIENNSSLSFLTYKLVNQTNGDSILFQPAKFNAALLPLMLNFGVCYSRSKNEPAWVLEPYTGRTLLKSTAENRNLITLKDLLANYPQRTIHYASCAVTQVGNKNENIALYADHKVFIGNKSDKYRFFKPATNIINTSLQHFYSNKARYNL